MKSPWNCLASTACILATSVTLHAGTYFVQSLGGTDGPPYPFDPTHGTAPMTEIGPDQYYVEDGDSESLQSGGMMMASSSLDPSDPSNTNIISGNASPVPNIRNYAKYSQQAFSLLNTNGMLDAGIDVLTNLYNACAAINGPTNSLPWLTIVPYGANGVIIRADNFDYSQTNVDLALLVCDKVETPTWKTIDFNGASDAQDGWLVQGTVPYAQVTSTMFMLVTNINTTYNAFFRVMPYAGPQVVITGTNQPYDVVSNIITLTTQIYDLSGTTNEIFVADVNGNSFAHATLSNNLITLDTKYSPNGQDYGIDNVDLTVEGFPTVYGLSTAPGNTQLIFNSATSIPLDFENVNYLLYQSAIAEQSIGTNAMLWVCNKEEDITCDIMDPSSNIVASYGGHITGPTIVEIDWDFTQADGVTPYSNDTYIVHFVASDPDDFEFPNYVKQNDEVRLAAGTFISYEQEDEHDWIYGTTSVFVNQQANTWLDQTLTYFYQDIYGGDLTGYSHGDVGDWRNYVQCTPQTLANEYWTNILQSPLGATIPWLPTRTPAEYSDLTIGGAHGTGYEIGGAAAHALSWPWNLIHDTFTAQQLQSWLQAVGPNWRLRKAAFWVCDMNNVRLYEPEHPGPNGQTNGTSLDFVSACGIRDTRDQLFNHIHKNTGWFTCGNLDELYISGIPSTDTDGKIACEADTMWACGANAYPGSCDPTYASEWVVEQMLGMYPKLDRAYGGSANLLCFGYPYLPYTPNYDDDMAANAGSHRPSYIKFPGVP
jgi:hypothetical protein